LLETQESFRVRNTELIVEKGTSLLIPVHSVHYDPHLYPHPKLFDSSRLKAYKSNSRHPFAYLPFGTFGPRSCIGLRFGKMQAKIGIVSLLQRFKFGDSDLRDIPLASDTRSAIVERI